VTAPPAPAAVVVIGIGNPFRADDGVGHAVADLVAQEVEAAALAAEATGRPSRLGRTEVVWSDGEPTRLLEAWAERDLAVVVDAMVTGAPPGFVHVFDPTVADLPAPPPTSSHGIGLAEAWRLAEVLESRPARLLLVGIEVGQLGDGTELSPPVAGAVPRALRLVHAAIAAAPYHLPRSEPDRDPVIDLRDPIHHPGAIP
jgi:hydrogenase maturation protease